MNAYVLQHVPFEGPGSIAGWLAQRGVVPQVVRLFAGDPLPASDASGLVIAMGGPMSVNDEATLPWLAPEKRFLRAMMQRNQPVLGVCLGAQLMAHALGARVYPNAEKEIGWFDIQGLPQAAAGFRFPERMRVFHWHGETFDLPEGAMHLARSAGCAHQAFQVGERAIGLQFHLETTPDTARRLVEHCRHELVAGRFIQAEEPLLAEPAASFTEINASMERLLAYLTRQ